MIKIEKLVLGYLDTNCYIVSSNNKAIIIDPADNCEQIINFCNKYEVIEIIVTHHHFDHVGALDAVKNHFQTQIYDIHNLKEGENKMIASKIKSYNQWLTDVTKKKYGIKF